jgi:HSP20 family protein
VYELFTLLILPEVIMKDPKDDKPSPSPGEDRVSTGAWSVVQSMTMRGSNRKFAPPTDVIEFPDRLVVLVEIAGMRAEGFQLTLLSHKLVISGVRERPPYDHPAYHQVEIDFGEFRVEVGLPWPVNQDDVDAAYGEGFLQVDLPRRDPETIPIVDITATDDEQEQV